MGRPTCGDSADMSTAPFFLARSLNSRHQSPEPVRTIIAGVLGRMQPRCQQSSCGFPCSHLLDHISPVCSPFFPVFGAFSPSRRGGSNEPQAGTQAQETAGKRKNATQIPAKSRDLPGFLSPASRTHGPSRCSVPGQEIGVKMTKEPQRIVIRAAQRTAPFWCQNGERMGSEFFTGQLLLVLLVVHHVAVRLQHHPAKRQQTSVNILVSSIFEACVDFNFWSNSDFSAVRNLLLEID